MANESISRQESVGIGLEAVPGTAVASQIWVKHLKNSLNKDTPNKLQNNSALGRVETYNDSVVDTISAEGPMEFKVGDISIGYFLYLAFGSVATATNADASGVVKDHTFTVLQSTLAPTATFAVKDKLASKRYTMGTTSEIEFTAQVGEWTKANAVVASKSGVSSSDTVAYTAENEFLMKHITAKIASNVAGLSGAPGLEAKSLKLKITQGARPYWTSKTGPSDDASQPRVFMRSGWEASGEIVLRWNSTTLQDLYTIGTKQAMSIQLQSPTTIGTAAKPTLTFTAPQVSFMDFDKSDDLDEVVEQTLGFTCELSTTAGYELQAVLTNLQTGYAPA